MCKSDIMYNEFGWVYKFILRVKYFIWIDNIIHNTGGHLGML